MATIEKYETKAGMKWLVRYRDAAGKQSMKRGFTTKTAARAFSDQVGVDLANGTFIKPTAGKILVNDLSEGWFARKTDKKPSYRKTIEYAWLAHVKPHWGHRQIRSIRPTEVEEWMKTLLSKRGTPASASVQRRAVGILAGILEGAVRDGMLATNPASGVNLPRIANKKHVYLSHREVEEIASLCSTMRPQYGLIVRLLGTSGIRWGELAALRVRDIEIDKRRLSINSSITNVAGHLIEAQPKTWEIRSVPFIASLTPAIRQQMKDKLPDALLFTNRHGGPLRGPERNEWFYLACDRLRNSHLNTLQDVVIHDLRHAAASFAVSAGANVLVVQRMLGHEDASETLKRYSDLFDSDLDAVANAVDSARLAGIRTA